MERLFKFKYPKLFFLLISIIVSYLIFSNDSIRLFLLNKGFYNNLGIFFSGMLFSFGFTSAISAGYFITFNTSNILLTALIGGIGAAFSDLVIFSVIRLSFMDEFNKLENEKFFKIISKKINNKMSRKFKVYLLYALAGIIIASPLPDELGVTMLVGLSKIKPLYLAILSFIFNSIGIFILLLV